ncbi:hypothetical protein VP01_6328g1, partial [Puccinia sorghi]
FHNGYFKLQSHVPEQKTFIGKQFYLVSSPLFDEFKKPHNALKAPGLEPNFKEDPGSFNCHLSFTISNLPNKPNKYNDASPFTFFIHDDSGGINFSGFNGIVECAWKATAYFHLTLPSNTPSKSLHTCMGYLSSSPRRLKRCGKKNLLSR